MHELFKILHEEESLLVVNKPAGLVCHPTKGDAFSSLISRLRLHLGSAAAPQLINRLDRETSGVVIVAKDATTARAWRRLWEDGGVTKTYLAIVHGHTPEHGVINAPLGRDEHSRVAVKDTVRPDGALARTEFQLIRHFTRPEGRFSLLQVQPVTGRKHQIRIHLAHHGHAIVGDKLYGASEDYYLDLVNGRLSEQQLKELLTEHQCLHAQSIECELAGRRLRFVAKPEARFLDFANGGSE